MCIRDRNRHLLTLWQAAALARGIQSIFASVPYTHLDVYKRQHLVGDQKVGRVPALPNEPMLDADQHRLLHRVHLPSATSWAFSSLHAEVGLNLVGAGVGEYLGPVRAWAI